MTAVRTQPNPELVEFAGNLAQELANIFTVAGGNLTLLEDLVAEDEAAKQAYNGTRRAVERGVLLIERLRTVACQQTLRRAPMDICHLVAKVVEERRLKLPPGVRIRSQFPRASCLAVTDREKFRDSLGEMIANASDALGRGGMVTVEVTTTRETGKEYVRIDVEDNGPGMEPALAARAARPLITTKPQTSRKGWGLALCEGFARQSEGLFEIDSVRGRGTTVSLLLPRHR